MIPDKLRTIDPIEDLFFKRRTVFSIDHTEYDTRDTAHESYAVGSKCGKTDVSELNADLYHLLSDRIGGGTLERRLKRDDCSLYFARDASDGEPAGFYWCVKATVAPIWHDSFRVPPGCGLVFNAYVSPDHRRQGVYRLLQSTTHNHLLAEEGCERVYTIVEDRNTASMRANQNFGLRKEGNNYLIKLFSINMLSHIDDSTGSKTHFVLPRGNI